MPASYRYPPKAFFWSVLFQDALLAAIIAGTLLLQPVRPFSAILATAAFVVLAWGAVTLHFPAEVGLAEAGITFRRYGRIHYFAWTDVRAVRVRRFLVRDRVLVRILPAAPWRGRYWITDGIEGYEDLVRTLEHRAAVRSP